jgi:hypothetical protein
MNDHMTVPEIEAAFPSEWVLIGDPETDQYHRVLSGSVICHNKDRDVVYSCAIDAKAKVIAVLYTGQVPGPGAAILI